MTVSKKESKPTDMSIMAQIKSQMQVSANIEKAAIEAAKPRDSDLEDNARIAEDKVKGLEAENLQLKRTISDLKSQVKRLGGEVEAQKEEAKKARTTKANRT